MRTVLRQILDDGQVEMQIEDDAGNIIYRYQCQSNNEEVLTKTIRENTLMVKGKEDAKKQTTDRVNAAITAANIP